MNTYFKLYTPGTRARAKREIDILYRDRPVGLKAEFTGDRYRFTLPPELDTKMIYGDLEARFRLAPSADLIPAPVALELSDRYE